MLYSIKQRLIRNYARKGILVLAQMVAAGLAKYGLRNDAHKMFSRYGYHLLQKHYYLPIPEESDLSEKFWTSQSELVGLKINDADALDLVQTVVANYLSEFRERFPLHRSSDAKTFYLINGAFMAVDAHVYYSLIRHFKPKRIVEIGSGFSTLLAAAASMQNLKEDGEGAHLTAIDPFVPDYLKHGLPGLSEIIEKKVQEVDFSLFTSLEPRDILFIDSTHVLRAAGDVQFEYCEVLPRLPAGVLVHIHDISLPKPYPRVYFETNHYYWNEQYLLQAFLAFNSRFEVLWPGNYMMLKYADQISRVLPEYQTMRESFPLSEPTSFWIRSTS
ncbi:MAG: class I SAM-dependent methyltransferase [Deltaproteobacteria bacterium]|nr:class I SAM-dependent methyltransferase [Deltaproteobacteria bacterium]